METKKRAVGVRLSLPADLKAWWDAMPSQEKAMRVQGMIRRSRDFKMWKATREQKP